MSDETTFADRFRDDRETNDNDAGAHAQRSAVDEQETTLGRFRAASHEAREKLSGARSTEELKSATSGTSPTSGTSRPRHESGLV